MSATMVALVVGAVAWLTAAATAVRSVSRIWLRHWVERRLSGAAVSAPGVERPQHLLLAAATAIAFLLFWAGAELGSVRGAGAGVVARWIAAVALATLLLGQILPRAVARRWAAQLVPVLVPPLRAVDLALSPLLFVARRLAARVAGARAAAASSPRDELEELLREGELEGVGDETEIAIISGVVEFGEKPVVAAMTPRSDVFALDERTPPAESARRIAEAGYSRIPVYRGSLEHVVGMVHAFDVLKEGGDRMPRLRPVATAPPDTLCNDLLFRMLRARHHLAVVRDASGVTVGIVTLEDLLEELVGDIRDEHDEPGGPASGPAAGRPE